VRLNERANEALYRVLSLTIVFRYKYTEPGLRLLPNKKRLAIPFCIDATTERHPNPFDRGRRGDGL
jgi:hypothetical protein